MNLAKEDPADRVQANGKKSQGKDNQRLGLEEGLPSIVAPMEMPRKQGDDIGDFIGRGLRQPFDGAAIPA